MRRGRKARRVLNRAARSSEYARTCYETAVRESQAKPRTGGGVMRSARESARVRE